MRKTILTVISAVCMIAISYGSFALSYIAHAQPSVESRGVDEGRVYTDSFGQTHDLSSGSINSENSAPNDSGSENSAPNNSGGENSAPNSSGGENSAPNSGGMGSIIDIRISNPLKNEYNTLCKVLEGVINLITMIGALIAVILIIWSGFKFITAQGNTAKLGEAKKALLTTIVGTAVLLGASVIAKIVVTTIFSITNKNNPGICNI